MAAPVLVAGVFFLASTATVVAFVGELRGWPTGRLSGLALLAPVVFTDKVAAQIADVPFAFFVLAAVSLLAIDRRAGAPGPPTLLAAGAAVGLAAWTKDEGLVPLVLLPLLCTVFPGTSSRRRMVGGLLAGAAPILLAVAGFKLLMAPPGYLFAQQSVGAVAGRLGSVDRLQFVVEQILARTLRPRGAPPPTP